MAGGCSDGLEEKPRFHYDGFVPAFLTCFLMLTGCWACLLYTSDAADEL